MKQTEEFVTFKLIEQKAIKGVPEPNIIQIHSVIKDATGRLYILDEFNHRIVVLDSEGKYAQTIGERGNGQGEFWYPRGLCIVEFESGERLVVCDSWNHRIQKFDLDGNFIGAFGSIGNGNDQFNEPVAVIPGCAGQIWILDRCNHRIKLCSLSGETLSIIGHHMTLEDEDRLNDPVHILLKPGGASSRTFGFNYPQALAKGPDGNFIIADTNNNRVCVIRENGEIAKFINLKSDTPPYYFPDSITTLSSGFALVSGINMPFRVMDVNRSWLSKTAQIGAYDPLIKPAVLFDGDGNDDTIMLFDPHKKLISKYSITGSIIDSDTPPIQQLSIDSEGVSGNWANMIGGAWFDYLTKAPETEQTTGQIKNFCATCRDEAKKAANEINEHEGEYLKHLVEYYLLDKAKSEGRPQNDLAPDISWKLLTLRQDEKRRTELRKVLIQNLSWIIRLFENLDSARRKNIVVAEELELAGLLEDEYKLRRDDHEKVLLWLKGSLRKVDTLNVSAALHACAGILFLTDHLQYLSVGLKRLGSDVVEMDEVLTTPEAILRVKGKGAIELAENILNTLGNLCLKWGNLESIKAIINSVAKLKKPYLKYALKRGLAMEYARAGDFDLAKKMLDREDDGTNIVILGELYLRNDRNNEALEALSEAYKTMAPENIVFKQMENLYIDALIVNKKTDKALSVIESSATSMSEPLLGIRMVQLHLQTGHFDEAINAFESVCQDAEIDGLAAPREAAALGLVSALAMNGCAKEALEFLNHNPTAVKKELKDVERATQLRCLGQLNDSSAILEQVLANQPSNTIALCNLGLNRALSGYEGKLTEIFEKAAKSGPKRLVNLAWGMSERIHGKCGDAMEKLAVEPQDTDLLAFKIAIERIITAICAGDDERSKSSLDILTSISSGSSYRHGISFHTNSQESLMGRAMKKISTRLEKDGIRFTYRKLYSNAICYSIGGGFKDSTE